MDPASEAVALLRGLLLPPAEPKPGQTWAAEIDGASTWQQFRHITLPMLRPTLAFVVLVTTILAFRLFDRLPKVGEKVMHEGYEFTVKGVSGLRISSLQVRRGPGPEAGPAEAPEPTSSVMVNSSRVSTGSSRPVPSAARAPAIMAATPALSSRWRATTILVITGRYR